MGEYIDSANNIIYNNVTGGTKVSKLTNGATDFSDEFVVPVVNAVEIDWNAANLGSYIINTTGQLLSYMSTISQKITNLENPIERSKA